MLSICKKELRQFFSSLTGYIAIVAYLVINATVLFVLPDNIFDFGYATLDRYFEIAPWILLLLIPAVTMRSFAEEYKTGTFELLRTLPLSNRQIVTGKYIGCLIVALLAIIPTIIYFFCVQSLSGDNGIDTGATVGAYLGLLLLAAVFTSIGVFSSSVTANPVVAFITAIVLSLLLYFVFDTISKLPVFENGADYYIELLGIQSHYRSICRGVVDIRDLCYFLSIIVFFLLLTYRQLFEKK